MAESSSAAYAGAATSATLAGAGPTRGPVALVGVSAVGIVGSAGSPRMPSGSGWRVGAGGTIELAPDPCARTTEPSSHVSALVTCE